MVTQGARGQMVTKRSAVTNGSKQESAGTYGDHNGRGGKWRQKEWCLKIAVFNRREKCLLKIAVSSRQEH